MPDPTLYILDPDSSCRDSLCELGSAMGLRICAYATASQFLVELRSDRPGCVIMEYHLPDRDACDVQDELYQRELLLPVIILTAHGDVASAVASMKRGAIDFLEKPFPPVRLRAIIERVIETHLDQWNREREKRRTLTLLGELTEDEREVAMHLAMGETNSQIAQKLEISLRTVQFRRSRLMQKMQVNQRAELVAKIFKAFQAQTFHALPTIHRPQQPDRLSEFLGIEFDSMRP